MNEQTKPIKERCANWRKVLLDADVGPLIIAKDVIAIVDNFEAHREGIEKAYGNETGELTPSAFLRRELGAGRDVAFFTRRANAIDRLGEVIKRYMHHQVAVWINENFTDETTAKQAK